ncbi:LVIVD repeat-containing protein [Natrialbaceae archaeon A-CW2]
MQRRSLLRSMGVATTVVGTGIGGLRTGISRTRATANSSYEPLGTVPVAGACEAVVGDDGQTVYLATVEGFATVDISDPTEPTVLVEEHDLLEGDRELTDILDVKVSEERLVVPGPANPAPGQFNGFVCYDVSDPADPVKLGSPYETDYHIHNCFLEGDRLYLVANDLEGNPLTIFDLGDDEPEEIGRWSLLDFEPGWGDVDPYLYYLHDVYVHDEVAYLAYWNAGTYLVDVSDPTEPEYISHVAETTLEEQREIPEGEINDYYIGLPGNDHYSAVDETGTIMAVGREAWATGAPEADRPGGIDIYDVSDPTEPTKTASIEPPETPDATYRSGQWTTAHNFELRDGWLYASWYRGGVSIHDLTDLEQPEEITAWRDPSVAAFWTARVAQPGDTFVASSTPIIPTANTEGALYVFSSEPGFQSDPPTFETAEDTDGTADDGTDGVTDDQDTNGTGAGTDDESSDADRATAADDESDGDSDDAEDPIPGFTGLAAAGAIAGGALALERRRQSEDGNAR